MSTTDTHATGVRTIDLLRTDLAAHATTLATFAVVAALVAGANLAMGGATSAAATCALTGAFLIGPLFANDERAHLDVMYSILPVPRTRFVLGRYLLVALSIAATTLVGVAVGWVDGVVRGPEPSPVPLSATAVVGLSLAVVGLVAAVQLPLFLALGHARTGTYSLGATMVLMFGGTALLRHFPDLATALLRWAGSPWTGAVGVTVAVVALAVSAAFSVRLYRRRDL